MVDAKPNAVNDEMHLTTIWSKLPSNPFRLPLHGGQTIMARLQIGPLFKYLARFYWVDALF